MNKQEAVEFLHKSKGYSRRMSAKLVDLAMLEKTNSVFALAMRQALEKARTKGAKDKTPRAHKRYKLLGATKEHLATHLFDTGTKRKHKIKDEPVNMEFLGDTPWGSSKTNRRGTK